jgi:hypothetical protein
MNNQGFSNDNLHIGDVRITEDLTVDGELNINEINVNSLTIGDPEYTLPTSAGTDGQVIVMNPDNTTSDWQDLSAGTARVVVNKFTGTTSRIRNQTENGDIISIQQDGFGSFQYTSDEFSEGSVIVIRAYGNWTYLRSSQAFIPEGKFWLLVGPPPNGPELLELFAPFPEKAFAGTFPSSEGSVGNWELNIQLTRLNATQFRLGGTLTNSLADVQNQVEIPIIFPQKVGNNPDIFTFPGYPFDVAVKWQDNSNQGGGNAWIYPTLCGYTQDLINAGTNVLATSENLTTDHTLLSNLTAGDAGHTQFALLAGRNGGQILSGGITPLHNLKLKSHTAGLDNVTVKDLNTQFNKNIDMDNNNIINANEITKTTPSGADLRVENNDGPLVLSAQGLSSNIQLATTNNVTVNSNLFESLALVNLFNANIVMNGNQIQNTTLVSSNTALECNATADLRLVGDTVDMAATNAITHAIGAVPKLTIDGAETTTFADFNMASNDLKDALNIIDASTQNKINMNDAASFNVINISSNGNGVIVQELSSGNNIGITSASSGMVALSGNLNIRNEDAAGELKISKVNGGNIVIDNFAGKILLDSKNGSVEINDGKIVYVSDGQMPASYASDTTYIFVGTRNTASQINLTGLSNVTLMGMSRDSSTIEYTGSGALITTLDEDFTLSNIRIKSAQVDGLVLDASNVAKNKLLTIQNCEFRNCKNLFDITGYDLVDIEQNIFTFIEGGSTLVPPKGVYTTDVSKLQLTSCEFIRWFQEGATPSTTEFNGDMVFIQGTCGAHNITNNVLHPQYDQNGIIIDAATTFVEVAINSNQFVDVNLNKPTFSILNTNSNADYDTEAIQEGNSLLPNLKSRLGMSYYTATPPTTTLTTINVPVNMVFTTGIINPFDVFGVTVDTTTNIGRITYNRKRPVNFQITGTFEVLFTAGNPTTQNVGITLAKNGSSLFGAGIVSYQTLSTAGTEPKQYTFGVIGAAEQNDYFEFQLVSNNLSASSDFEVRSFLISGIEI